MKRFTNMLAATALVAIVAFPIDFAFAGGKGSKGGSSLGRSNGGGRSIGARVSGGSFKSQGRSMPSGGFSSKGRIGLGNSSKGNGNSNGGFNGNANGGIGKSPIVKSPVGGGSNDKGRRPQIGDVVKKPVNGIKVDGIKRPSLGDLVKKPGSHGNGNGHGNHGNGNHGHHDHDHHGHHGHHDHHNDHAHHGHHDHHHGHHHHGHNHGFCFTLPILPPVRREVVVVEEVVVVPAAPVAPVTPAAPVPAKDAAAEEASKQAAADAAEKALDNAQAADKLPEVPVGATLTLQGDGLGEKQGKVAVQIGQLSIPATLVKWDGKSTTVTLPEIGIVDTTTAQIHVFTAESKLVSSLSVQLVPASEAAPAHEAPTDAAPATRQAGEPTVGQSQVVNN